MDTDLAKFEAEMKEKGRLSQTETEEEDEPERDDEKGRKKKKKDAQKGTAGRKKVKSKSNILADMIIL